MLRFSDLDKDIKGFIFELDDVLFPKKDYLLQVYYLFANLLEYTETVPPARDLTEFLKTAYLHHGEEGLFKKAAETFAIDNKYEAHFKRIHVQAKLPLKLYLYKDLLAMLQEARRAGKKLMLLTKGNPLQQLNKIKQLEWKGLDNYLKVYFYDELLLQGKEPLTYVLRENNLMGSETMLITPPSGNSDFIQEDDLHIAKVNLFLFSADVANEG